MGCLISVSKFELYDLILEFSVFFLGSRMWEQPESNGVIISKHQRDQQELQVISEDCDTKKVCSCLIILRFLILVVIFFVLFAFGKVNPTTFLE
jgi:hypothetical protein